MRIGPPDPPAHGPALLLGELAQQAGGPGEQRDPTQHGERDADVGEGGATDARAVEGQVPSEDLFVDPADRAEEAQVGSQCAGLLRDRHEARRPRVLDLVHRVPEPGNVAARLACFPDGDPSQLVPADRVVV